MAEPFDLLVRAARGDADCQRELAMMALHAARDPEGVCDPLVTITEGLVFARMAASFGEVEDHGLFISLVALLCAIEGADACPQQLAEALARASIAADLGNEDAARMLPILAESSPAEVMAEAKKIEKLLRKD